MIEKLTLFRNYAVEDPENVRLKPALTEAKAILSQLKGQDHSASDIRARTA